MTIVVRESDRPLWSEQTIRPFCYPAHHQEAVRVTSSAIQNLDAVRELFPEVTENLFGGDRTTQPAELLDTNTSGWSESLQTVLAQPPATFSRQLICLGLVAVGVFGTWACVGRMQEVSSATGELVPQGETYKIQPVATGEINHVVVAEGDRVRQGDLLFTIESTLLENEIARLEMTSSATRTELRQVQSLIEKTRRENLAQQQSAEADIQAKRATREQSLASAQTSEGLMVSLADEASAYEERLERLSGLEAQGAISREYLFEVEQGVRDRHKNLRQMSGELTQGLSQIQQMEAELAQTRAIAQQIALSGEQALQKLIVEAGQLEAALADTTLQIEEVQTRLAQTRVKSPADGIISSLEIDNVGEFAQPGITLAEIVPNDTPLVLSTLVPQSKAGLIEPDMPVKIKLDAFPYQNYGVLSGTVLSISPDVKQSPDTSSGYQVEIALEQDYVLHEGSSVSLQVGQTATADIVVRRRRIIDLVLDPIRRLRADELTL